jgi:3-oxoacyl-[acyl-carrier-protein] synthase II
MRKVVITGAGVISSLGDSLDSLQAALREGRSGLYPVERFDTEGLSCWLGGEIKNFNAQKYLGNKNLRPLDRTSQLATSAAALALDDSGWTIELRNETEVGLALGTMFCSVHTISEFDRRAITAGPGYASPMDFANTVINAAAGQTAIMHNLRGINSTISVGASSGLRAIAYATDCIRADRAKAMLAGGVEELCFESFYGFDRAGFLCRTCLDENDFPRPFGVRRNGTVLGEGAAFLMLEDEEFANRRGANLLAEIKGYGNGFDSSRGSDEEKSIAAMTRTMKQALQTANIAPREIDCISASANGNRTKDRHEAFAIKTVFNGSSSRLPVTAIKSMLGETLGAGGAIQTAAMLAAMRDGNLSGVVRLEQIEEELPTQNVSAQSTKVDVRLCQINSIGFEGNSCSLIMAREC